MIPPSIGYYPRAVCEGPNEDISQSSVSAAVVDMDAGDVALYCRSLNPVSSRRAHVQCRFSLGAATELKPPKGLALGCFLNYEPGEAGALYRFWADLVATPLDGHPLPSVDVFAARSRDATFQSAAPWDKRVLANLMGRVRSGEVMRVGKNAQNTGRIGVVALLRGVFAGSAASGGGGGPDVTLNGWDLQAQVSAPPNAPYLTIDPLNSGSSVRIQLVRGDGTGGSWRNPGVTGNVTKYLRMLAPATAPAPVDVEKWSAIPAEATVWLDVERIDAPDVEMQRSLV